MGGTSHCLWHGGPEVTGMEDGMLQAGCTWFVDFPLLNLSGSPLLWLFLDTWGKNMLGRDQTLFALLGGPFLGEAAWTQNKMCVPCWNLESLLWQGMSVILSLVPHFIEEESKFPKSWGSAIDKAKTRIHHAFWLFLQCSFCSAWWVATGIVTDWENGGGDLVAKSCLALVTPRTVAC